MNNLNLELAVRYKKVTQSTRTCDIINLRDTKTPLKVYRIYPKVKNHKSYQHVTPKNPFTQKWKHR